MYGYVCDKCGANLDPGEHCDCEEEREQERALMSALVKEGADGQIILNLEVMQYAGN